MGHISKADVQKIALLSRVHLSDEEIDTFSNQLEGILSYMDTLSEVDVNGVEPFISAAGSGNVFREDKAVEGLPREAALKNAPQQGGGFFKVPPVQG